MSFNPFNQLSYRYVNPFGDAESRRPDMGAAEYFEHTTRVWWGELQRIATELKLGDVVGTNDTRETVVTRILRTIRAQEDIQAHLRKEIKAQEASLINAYAEIKRIDLLRIEAEKANKPKRKARKKP